MSNLSYNSFKIAMPGVELGIEFNGLGVWKTILLWLERLDSLGYIQHVLTVRERNIIRTVCEKGALSKK